MIAKLIVWGDGREECFARSQRSLAAYDIEDIPTIIPFHRLMLTDDTFVDGTYTTTYLDDDLDTERIQGAQDRWGRESAGSEPDDEAEVVRREFTVEVDGKRFQVDLKEHDAPAIDVEAARATSSSSSRR